MKIPPCIQLFRNLKLIFLRIFNRDNKIDTKNKKKLNFCIKGDDKIINLIIKGKSKNVKILIC